MVQANKSIVKHKTLLFAKFQRECKTCGIYLVALKKYIRKGDPIPEWITQDSIPNYRLLKRSESRPRKIYQKLKP